MRSDPPLEFAGRLHSFYFCGNVNNRMSMRKYISAIRLLLLSCLTILIIMDSIGCTSGKANPDKGTKLLAAAASNDTTAIRQLLEEGVKIETRDNSGRTPLMIATYQNHLAAARLLMEAGADVNAQDDMRNSPFLYAGASGYLDIVRLCLQHHANFNVLNRYGGTALIPAAEKGHVEVVSLLANTKGFPIDHINNLGWTALLEAVILSDGGPKHQQIVQLLVDAGCNVNIADRDGITPLQHARKKGYTKMVNILEKEGAK